MVTCLLPSREEGKWRSSMEEVLHLDEACRMLGKKLLPHALYAGADFAIPACTLPLCRASNGPAGTGQKAVACSAEAG